MKLRRQGEMPDDLRKSVVRFSYPAFTVMWAVLAYMNGPDALGWLFAAFSAWTLYRTIVIWRMDRNEL